MKGEIFIFYLESGKSNTCFDQFSRAYPALLRTSHKTLCSLPDSLGTFAFRMHLSRMKLPQHKTPKSHGEARYRHTRWQIQVKAASTSLQPI